MRAVFSPLRPCSPSVAPLSKPSTKFLDGVHMSKATCLATPHSCRRFRTFHLSAGVLAKHVTHESVATLFPRVLPLKLVLSGILSQSRSLPRDGYDFDIFSATETGGFQRHLYWEIADTGPDLFTFTCRLSGVATVTKMARTDDARCTSSFGIRTNEASRLCSATHQMVHLQRQRHRLEINTRDRRHSFQPRHSRTSTGSTLQGITSVPAGST
ncbi:hypothetical protein DOTSEDRAFT_72077 [Dothistroma septosporum NZE10]|uniref:Uncharacterized protein n=1 Tax=Dothistroma septosporum (strain NZE10 / CBS 128990) TaxID=675120 RepID=N1PLV4_DOTSN|nr:hypothetical protein DOTSEDRAFT_72077 [Dothistroma septosporum NZE10]